MTETKRSVTHRAWARHQKQLKDEIEAAHKLLSVDDGDTLDSIRDALEDAAVHIASAVEAVSLLQTIEELYDRP